MLGGAGEDSFRFSSALGNGNVDLISDFRVADDEILLDHRIFTAAGVAGALALGAFHSSGSGVAQDANDRIIYNTATGSLTYDADGSGSGAAVEFARLSANLNLSSADFFII